MVFIIIRTEQELLEVEHKLKGTDVYCADCETVDRGYPNINLTGISVGWSEDEGAYIPVGHVGGAQLRKELVLEALTPIFKSNRILVAHNAKYDMQVLSLHGAFDFMELYYKAIREHTVPRVFCTMVASWLLDTESEHGLKPLIARYRDYRMVELDEFCPTEKDKKTGDKVYRTDLVDIYTMGKYAVDDAVQPLWLMNHFCPMLAEEKFSKTFFELEMPWMFVLMHMERQGVYIDVPTLQEHKKTAPLKLAEVEKEVYELRPSKEPFNPGSSKQLNDILFNELGITPIGEPGKSGDYSVNKENLEVWAVKYPICNKILEYRSLQTLLGTYITGLDKRIGEDGRIRTRFNQILATGRLSSSRPNLQNIPRPDNDIFNLRSMFCSPVGKKLVVADYSQIELRVLAHISRDPEFVKAFKNGEDLHSFAAKILFNLKEDLAEIKKKHAKERSVGKTFNFAMCYEAGVKRLAVSAGVSQDKASAFKKRYMKRFVGIQAYIERQHALAAEYGYVRTITGRKRHLPDAQLKEQTQKAISLREAAFRRASNSSVQGSAADVIAIAMRNVFEELYRRDWLNKAYFVLQVHDEMILEVDDDICEEVAEIVKSKMESAVKLRVPVIADLGIGDRWSEAKS